MQVLVNTDASIEGRESMEQEVAAVVSHALERFERDITRVEVHLSDENAGRGGESDKRCLMEARLTGRQPLAVSHKAGSMRLAVDGAAEKLQTAVGNMLGRLRDRRPSPGAAPEDSEA
ncbi:MAG: HPF/RaiA family ribosome-associated protein [Pseudomonadales bacterium]